MLKSKKAESLIWIVIWMFILWFTLMWIISILTFNKDISWNYEEEIYKYIIKSNWDNLIKKIDTSGVNYDENFYIYKDTVNKEFKIFTWTTNQNYSYTNYLWNLVNPVENIWKTYKRVYNNEIDVLKHSLNPEEIPNLIMKFDAINIDWTNNSTYTDWQSITTWNELINNFDATQITPTKKPTYDEDAINWKPWVVYDWWDILKINNNILINTDDPEDHSNCWVWQNVFNEKSFAIVFKTWMNVTLDQAIYEQWWEATWYNFMIHNWDIYAWIHNKATVAEPYYCFDYTNQERDLSHRYKSVNLWEAIPDTVYFIMIVQDSSNFDTSLNEIDAQNKLQIYMNWILVDETDHVDPQPEHWKIWLWGINEYNVKPRDTNPSTNTITCTECNYFNWTIWEFISWNHALSENEVRWIQNYFNEKWLGWYWNIFYNVIGNETRKYNN